MTASSIRIGVAVPRSWGTRWIRQALECWGRPFSIALYTGVIPGSPESESVALWLAHERFTPPPECVAPILKVVGPNDDPPTGFAVRTGDEKRLIALIRDWADPFPPAFEPFPEPLVLLDDQCRVVRANGEGRAMLQLRVGSKEYDESLWLGSAVADALADGKPAPGQSLFLEEVEFMDAQGDNRTAGVRLWRRPCGEVVALFQDDSRRSGLKRRGEQSDRLGSIGRLAGGIAHDLNNILMVITSYTGLIRRKGQLTAPVPGFLDEIGKAADRAVRLTDQLLAFAQRQALQPRPADLGALVRDRLPRLRQILGPSIQVETALHDGLPSVAVDVDKFAEVLDQLASNARDAMPSGGAVMIEASLAHDPADWRAACPDLGPGPFVVLLFSDTGHGMSPDVCDSIFEPFFTTKGKGKGTGMGMAMAYGFIRQSGGQILCSSQPSLGTVIRILLPVSETGEAVPAPGIVAPVDLPGKSRRVLVVEDEEAVLSSIVSILESLGFSVFSARTGEEAVKLVQGSKAPPALIISDVILPGMDGKQAVEIILKVRPGVPVLFMSGYSGAILTKRGILPPGLAYLQKPFTVETLTARIAALLGRG